MRDPESPRRRCGASILIEAEQNDMAQRFGPLDPSPSHGKDTDGNLCGLRRDLARLRVELRKTA